jgi:type III secretion system YscI/HrpB-like protein
MILQGLQKLRGVFDQQNTKIGAIMDNQMIDSRSLLAMQVEVVNFSLLVDVTSKLTGKATQSFETLMKGQ